MSQDERKLWAHAARQALDGVTIGQLRDAAKEAMATVDHPSKIVPAIRKALASGYQPFVPAIPRPAPSLALPRDDVQADAERKEVGQLMKGLVRELEARTQ